MNGFKRIIIWALLSVLMQAAGLLYLDKVYFKQSSDFKVQEPKKEVIPNNVDLSIPNEATKIESSFDGKYVTYFVENKLYLLDTKNGTSEEIITNDEKREVLYSKWLSDSNMLTIAEKKVGSSSKKNIVDILGFTANNKKEKSFTEKGVLITYTNGMEIVGIETETKNGVIYIPVNTNGSTSTIVRRNIDGKFENIPIKNMTVSELLIYPNKNGDMIYKDKKNNKFYSYSNGKSTIINFTDSNKYELLGIDSKDNVYWGELGAGDKITKIVYGSIDTKIATWKTVQLDKGVSKKEIYINNKNEILVNNSLEGKVKNLTTNVEVSYSGKFISVNNKVILSKDNDKLYVKNLAEESNKETK
ncbi:hypothetical protein NNC19_03560 [Clostridium sp. SHJSY1]|uniref:hypothetical protein n=1 Tax=Clostridium sp. SHJSY1 TaxID=2942483 RepID=UPI002874F6B8|nr:hypothetical protein [Clostridium sp. SHJSY1]MDS0524743.1 hypothetical protein [Clostridium sp. SHJSY1]